jgi:uncharacterized protein YegJ (DUF2314 family)
MKLHLILILSVTLLLALHLVCTNAQIRKKTTENMYSTTDEDTAMNAAMATARRRFGQFDSAFRSGKYEPRQFSIKVRFSNPNGHEYIWVTEIVSQKGQYWGVLSDTPATVINARFGDKLPISRRDVADWLYGRDSILHGGFTIRVLEQRMSKEERARHDANFPFKLED